MCTQYVYKHMPLYTHVHLKHVYMYVRTQTHMTHVHTYNVCTYMHKCMYMLTHVHVDIHKFNVTAPQVQCMYICICNVYVHTCTFINTWTPLLGWLLQPTVLRHQ